MGICSRLGGFFLAAVGFLLLSATSSFAGCSISPTTSYTISAPTTVTCSAGTQTINGFPLSVSLTNSGSLSFLVSNTATGVNTTYNGVISVPSNYFSQINVDVGTGNTLTFLNPNAFTDYYGAINIISGSLVNSAGGWNSNHIGVTPNNSPNVFCFGCSGFANVSVNAPKAITKPTEMTLWLLVSGQQPLFVQRFVLNPNSSQLVQFSQLPNVLNQSANSVSTLFVAEQGSTYKDYTTIPNDSLGYIVSHHPTVPTFRTTVVSVQALDGIFNSLPSDHTTYNPDTYYLVFDTKANILAADANANGSLHKLINYDPNNNKYAVIVGFFFTDNIVSSNGLANTMPVVGVAGDMIVQNSTTIGRLLANGSYSPTSGETVQATGNVVVPYIQDGATVIANGQNSSVPQIGSVGTGGTLNVIAGKASLGSVDGGTLSVEDGTSVTGINSAAVAVNSGVASINGTAEADMTVGNNATLKGSGTLTGNTTIGSGGTLSPGNSPGVLTSTASITQASGSSLNIDIDGPTAGNGGGYYSRLVITGANNTYTIAPNASLTPTLRGIIEASISEGVTNTYTPPMGSKFEIVQAAGGVTGTFSNLVQPSSGLNPGFHFVDTYPTNAVNLYVVPDSYAAIGAAKSINAGRLGSVIDRVSQPTADRATALGSFYSLPDNASAANALQQLSGYSQTTIVNAAIKGQAAIAQTVDDRMAALRRDGGLSGTDISTVLFSNSPISGAGGAVNSLVRNMNAAEAASAKIADGKVWMMPVYQISRGSADANSTGTKTTTLGAVVGTDMLYSGSAIVGGALSYIENSLDGANKATNYGVSVYGQGKVNSLYVTGKFVSSFDSYELNRSLSFSDLSRTAASKAGGFQANLGSEVGYEKSLNDVIFAPFVGVSVKSVYRSGFTETGANALNLSLNSYNTFNLNTKAGLRLSHKLELDGYAVVPFAEVSWLHDFVDPTVNLGSNIFSIPYSIQGTNFGRDAAIVGAGLSISRSESLKFLAKYAGEFRKNETVNRFELGLVAKW